MFDLMLLAYMRLRTTSKVGKCNIAIKVGNFIALLKANLNEVNWNGNVRLALQRDLNDQYLLTLSRRVMKRCLSLD